MKTQIITGHEEEIAQLAIDAVSPETRALTIKFSGEALAEYGETLRLAALGLLAPITDNIFGEPELVDDQVATAEAMIVRRMEILRKVLAK